MRKLIEYLRITFISFEFLYAIGISALALFLPNAPSAVGETLKGNTEMLKWIPVLPLAICGVVFKLAWRLTSPSSGSNRELYEWPDYWRLTCRRDFSIVLSAFVALASVSLWIFSGSISNFWLGYLFCLALGVAGIDLACLTFACFRIKEITEP